MVIISPAVVVRIEVVKDTTLDQHSLVRFTVAVVVDVVTAVGFVRMNGRTIHRRVVTVATL